GNLGLYSKEKNSVIIDEKQNPKRNHKTLDAMSQGNLTSGIRLIDLTSSYQSIAHGGNNSSAHVVESIEDPQGKQIYQSNFKDKKIQTPESNYLLAQLLERNTKRHPLNQIQKDEWMGVFGTNKYQSDQFIIGSTPNFTI